MRVGRAGAAPYARWRAHQRPWPGRRDAGLGSAAPASRRRPPPGAAAEPARSGSLAQIRGAKTTASVSTPISRPPIGASAVNRSASPAHRVPDGRGHQCRERGAGPDQWPIRDGAACQVMSGMLSSSSGRLTVVAAASRSTAVSTAPMTRAAAARALVPSSARVRRSISDRRPSVPTTCFADGSLDSAPNQPPRARRARSARRRAPRRGQARRR